VSIDSHCHLADAVFAPDLPAVVARAQAAGLTRAICILSADEEAELSRAPDLAALWPDVEFATGIHPHRSGPFGGRRDQAADAVATAVGRVHAVAVGEIGLDYHYDFAPPAVQREVFSAQVELARSLGRPVVIHTREAWSDTVDVLRGSGEGVRGVMHCFTGTIAEAREALDLGFYLSFSGIVTFPRADALRAVAAFIPADRILIETDAPYLAPVPYRGRRNEPAWVANTLSVVAGVRGMSPDDLGSQLRINLAELIGRAPGPVAR
jgi:TatD DNase family protein